MAAALWMATVTTSGQVVVDRTIATVSDGARTELITRSDLLWQLALQPGAPINPPREEDLRQALQTQINQRIFALEAQRLPRAAPTDKEIADKIADILKFFSSTAEFESRLKTVGFSSVKDDNFENIIGQRVAIEKYLDFRFRSFVVVTADDEAAYYRDKWVPEFRRINPSAIVPTLDEARARVNTAVVEERVAVNIETFIEEAKRRVQIVIISEPTGTA
ncbi:MAG TPA: hypothetical protein PLK77_05125 [Pyrinomonadaceae bacterium]|nr:hypothetical protein [Pyrinomonadaceae bacterium]